MPRPIPPLLAPLVELLELEHPQIVTIDQLATMLRSLQLSTSPAKAAYRLRERGWLLPTGVRGAYEFAPGERAGPISQADALMSVRAVLSEDRSVRLAAALGTALALQNLSDRGPDVPELALPKDRKIPRPLRGPRLRIVRFDWSLPTLLVQGVPVHRPATVLVHLAHRPTEVRSWAAILEVLPRLIAASTVEEIAEEMQGRPQTTHVRLAYLTQGAAPDLAHALGISRAGKTWFGPRGALRRHDAAWNVADTILPFGPHELIPATDVKTTPARRAATTSVTPDAAKPRP